MWRVLVITSLHCGGMLSPHLVSPQSTPSGESSAWTGQLTGLAALQDSARPSFKLPNYQFLTNPHPTPPPQTQALRPPLPETPPTAVEYPYTDFEPTQSSPAPSL